MPRCSNSMAASISFSPTPVLGNSLPSGRFPKPTLTKCSTATSKGCSSRCKGAAALAGRRVDHFDRCDCLDQSGTCVQCVLRDKGCDTLICTQLDPAPASPSDPR